jgi:nucleoside-diphosphate-sugar epimerase
MGHQMSILERVAVLGASGWVGRTACRWLTELDTQILAIASSNRVEKVGSTLVQYETFDLARVKDFKPTTVIDAAFITRERLGTTTLQNYVGWNEKLIEQALNTQRLPSVEKFIGVSSGASVRHLKEESADLSLDPYGILKARYEKHLVENSELRVKTTIARIWSVSGDLVTKPKLFAFSNLIHQAMTGHIDINSSRNVFRRFVDLQDFVKVVCLSNPGPSRVIDSGGKLVEIGDLANLIFYQLGFPPSVGRSLRADCESDSYHSDDSSWQASLEEINYMPLTLEEQIVKVATAFGFKH